MTNTVITTAAGVHTAYFYYLDYETGQPIISVYTKHDPDHPLGGVRQVAQELADNHLGPRTDPTYGGDEFEDITRTWKGYFIVALEGASFSSPNPITFLCDSGSVPQSLGNDGRHTFTPLGTFEIDSRGKSLSVTAYLYRAQSFIRPDDLDEGEREHYRIRFSADGISAATVTYDDSGGTNMGPPPPPPFAPPASPES
ncbi:MAG TPA: hypothetical protein VF547_03360 [Allosphingosinicella sp.]|jgi:hypothetical protein